MVVSLPPGHTTARRQSRLRRVARGVAFGAVVACLGLSGPPSRALAARANAHGAPPAPEILTRATVADRAGNTMPTALWARFVAAYAGPGSDALPDDAVADAAGCRKAGGDYLVAAAFDVRDDLPGMPNASDRPSGRAHLAILACGDERTLVDRSVRIDGEPVPVAEAGTVDALGDAWQRAIPAGLAAADVAIGRIGRVRRLDSGGSRSEIVVLLGTIPAHAVLADVATANRTPRRPPLHLTVTRAIPGGAEAIAGQPRGNDPAPAAGDVIEYAPPAAAERARYSGEVRTNGTGASGASTT